MTSVARIEESLSLRRIHGTQDDHRSAHVCFEPHRRPWRLVFARQGYGRRLDTHCSLCPHWTDLGIVGTRNDLLNLEFDRERALGNAHRCRQHHPFRTTFYLNLGLSHSGRVHPLPFLHRFVLDYRIHDATWRLMPNPIKPRSNLRNAKCQRLASPTFSHHGYPRRPPNTPRAP